jgi:MGT family glycosyltransferase
MKYAHIAIFSTPGPTHVHPTLTILASLVRRGYRVTYVTSQRFAAMVGELGAEIVLCPRIEFPFDQDRGETQPIERQYSPHIIDLAARTIQLVLPFYESDPPDLILYDAAAYAGLVVAERLGVPAVRVSPQFACSEASLQCGTVPVAWREAKLKLNRNSDAFFHAQGIRRDDVIFDLTEPTVYFYVEEFQLGHYARGDSNLYAGRCAAERPCPIASQPRRAATMPAVLVTTSTVYNQGPQYYRMCLDALAELRCHVVLALSSHTDASAFGPTPPDCEIVQDVPLAPLMAHMDLIICLAGMSTTMEAMYHGLPMLMPTHGHPELEAYAQNIDNLGLGIHLPGAASVERVAHSVRVMIGDRALHARVREMRDKVRRSAGGEEVVNWLEQRFFGRERLSAVRPNATVLHRAS